MFETTNQKVTFEKFLKMLEVFLSNLTDNDYSDMIWRIPSYIYTYIHIYIYIYILKLFDAIVYYGVFT